jgi:radical SAM protein with 4Fe4S-binding SPASM domain
VDIYKRCSTGTDEEKYQDVPDFPLYIDIELTNICNFKCLFCPTGVGATTRPRGQMDEIVFSKIVSEIEQYKTPIRFIRWGEPLLHPQVFDFIKILNSKKILCHINTNGLRLDEKLMKKLVELPLDSIKFSFQGVDQKSYTEMRNIDFFNELLNKIKRLSELRGNAEKPYIQVSTTITYETTDMIHNFVEQVKNYVDYLNIGFTKLTYIDDDKIMLRPEEKNRLLMLREHERISKKIRECPEIFHKMSIDWDGMVTACCGDYDRFMNIGNICNSTLQEIWKSKKLDTFRKMIINNEHDRMPLCKTCYETIPLRHGERERERERER